MAFIFPLLAIQSEESIFKLNGIFGCTVIVTVSVALHGPLAADITYFHTPVPRVTVVLGAFGEVVAGAPARGNQVMVVPAPPVTVADKLTVGLVEPVTQKTRLPGFTLL
jgi:hypothetical protein